MMMVMMMIIVMMMKMILWLFSNGKLRYMGKLRGLLAGEQAAGPPKVQEAARTTHTSTISHTTNCKGRPRFPGAIRFRNSCSSVRLVQSETCDLTTRPPTTANPEDVVPQRRRPNESHRPSLLSSFQSSSRSTPVLKDDAAGTGTWG